MSRDWNPDLFVRRAGRIHHADPKHPQEFCDFCLAPDPAWEYPAAPMEVVGGTLIDRSDDEFASCDECSTLIEAKKIGALVERMVQRQRQHVPEGYGIPPLALHRRLSRRNLLRFFDARTGPRRRYVPTRKGGNR